ncbi:MAG: RimK family alpha-L-glutamate ligase [Saprospiraceae bacterium]
MQILILSRNINLYSTQSLVNACKMRGHTVHVIDHQLCDLVIQPGKTSIQYQGMQLLNIDAIIPRIGATATQYGASVIRQFECMGVVTLTRADALLSARDKLTCLQILSNHGLPVPKTLVSNPIMMDPGFIQGNLTAPLVVKLQESTHGLGVILSESYANAESIVETMYKLRERVIIQDFIKEAKGADIRAFVVGDQVVASMKRQSKPGEFRSNLHRGATASIEALTDLETEIVLQATKVIGLDVAGVDILRSNSGPLIMEVNASPGLEGIETVTGVNIADTIVSRLEQKCQSI